MSVLRNCCQYHYDGSSEAVSPIRMPSQTVSTVIGNQKINVVLVDAQHFSWPRTLALRLQLQQV